jgi:transcriptional regulator with XRE-family HTH domain
MTRQQRRKRPRDDEEAAAFKGMGQAVTIIRERRGMDQDTLAAKAEMTRSELEKIERGELDEWWGGLRMVAKAFGMPFPALMMEAEEFAPGKGARSGGRVPERLKRAARSPAREAMPPKGNQSSRRSGRRGRGLRAVAVRVSGFRVGGPSKPEKLSRIEPNLSLCKR